VNGGLGELDADGGRNIDVVAGEFELTRSFVYLPRFWSGDVEVEGGKPTIVGRMEPAWPVSANDVPAGFVT
jgi:hypothetical protein